MPDPAVCSVRLHDSAAPEQDPVGPPFSLPSLPYVGLIIVIDGQPWRVTGPVQVMINQPGSWAARLDEPHLVSALAERAAGIFT